MMSEPTKLQVLAVNFKALLEKYAKERDPGAELLLGWVTPLLNDVETGVITHGRYMFKHALGYEPDFFERHPDVKEAQTMFVAELEGWENQEWYKKLTGGTS